MKGIKRQEIIVCSLFGGKISCHFTGCIFQIFSVDVDIDVNTNFYLNTLVSVSLVVF